MRVLFGTMGYPCGIHEIASAVKRSGFAEVKIHPINESFYRVLAEWQAHIVGLRIEGGLFETVCEQIRRIRSFSNATVILGGPTATSHPAEVLEQTEADYVFIGDAEHSVLQFFEAARRTNSYDELPNIPGIAYRWNDKRFINLPQGNSWDELSGKKPIPSISEAALRENILDWSLLEGFEEAQPFDSLYLTGGRGCPGQCSFCSRLHGQQVRTKTTAQLLEEIRGAHQLVQDGKMRLTNWKLYEFVNDISLQNLTVSWCSVFDEDFFLDKRRAVQFLQQFEFYGFHRQYRLCFQTNPCSLLNRDGNTDAELFYWISRLKAMIQVGGESFHPAMLRRWNKRHTVQQLETVLDALEKTEQDYNLFYILTDYDTTVQELYETTALLLCSARKHRRMRIAVTPFMIPLFDTDLRRGLEFQGVLNFKHFTNYEVPHPELMNPQVVSLVDRLDEVLQDALYLPKKNEALNKVETILSRIC